MCVTIIIPILKFKTVVAQSSKVPINPIITNRHVNICIWIMGNVIKSVCSIVHCSTFGFRMTYRLLVRFKTVTADMAI